MDIVAAYYCAISCRRLFKIPSYKYLPTLEWYCVGVNYLAMAYFGNKMLRNSEKLRCSLWRR